MTRIRNSKNLKRRSLNSGSTSDWEKEGWEAKKKELAK